MVADMGPIPLGSVYASMDRIVGRGISPVRAEAVFHPRLNAVSLEFRHEFVTYRQFWDEAARRGFAAALERYNAEFEARSLVNRHRQTRSAYGRVAARLEWQTARFTTVHASYPAIELGYRFREVDVGGRWESRPFFAALMRPARSAENHPGAGQSESRQLRMYFTRAQAAEIAALFDQPFLMAAVGAREAAPAPAAAPPLWDDFPAGGRMPAPAAEPPADPAGGGADGAGDPAGEGLSPGFGGAGAPEGP